MSTPHINAEMGDFADVVIMPGDPLRAKFIADNFLTNVVQVCDVRNMFGFTGEYKGRRISVMGHGMGIPSVSIYTTELIKDFGVKTIIRVGSCGAVLDDVNLGDIVIAAGASTDSKVNRIRFNNHDFAAIADYELVANAMNTAETQGVKVKAGNVFTADLFYSAEPEFFKKMAKYGVLGVDMEAAGLYGVAAEYGAKALTILTVSDHITRGEAASSEARQTGFKAMIELAFESVLLGDKRAL